MLSKLRVRMIMYVHIRKFWWFIRFCIKTINSLMLGFEKCRGMLFTIFLDFADFYWLVIYSCLLCSWTLERNGLYKKCIKKLLNINLFGYESSKFSIAVSDNGYISLFLLWNLHLISFDSFKRHLWLLLTQFKFVDY